MSVKIRGIIELNKFKNLRLEGNHGGRKEARGYNRK